MKRQLHIHSSDITDEAIEAAVDRIVSSPSFVRSGRLASFLRYIVRMYLSGQQEQLKEFSIGSEVFERGSSFDPRLDSLVRVEARRLRSKLEVYYQTEGKHDRVVIQVPPFGYAPLVLRRDQVPVPERSRSIMIGEFRSLSNEQEMEQTALGLRDDLISALTKQPELEIVAQMVEANGSSAQWSRAAFLLDGSVRRAIPEGYRVSAHLLSTATGVYLWAEGYDELRTDARMPTSIAKTIALAVQTCVLSGASRTPPGHESNKSESVSA